MHFYTGIDWSYVLVVPSLYLTTTEDPIVLRFNNTLNRELFESRRMIGGQLNDSFVQSTAPLIADNVTYAPIAGCSLGDWYYESDQRHYYLCVSGKGRQTQFDSVHINGIYCRDTCPKPGISCPVTDIGRFSSSAQWVKRPSEVDYEWRQPIAGDDLYINCSWSMTFDL